MQQGADVESGYLGVTIEENRRVSITQDLIREVCGPEALAEIKRRATGYVTNNVIITRRLRNVGMT